MIKQEISKQKYNFGADNANRSSINNDIHNRENKIKEVNRQYSNVNLDFRSLILVKMNSPL